MAAQKTQDCFQGTRPGLPSNCFGSGTQTMSEQNMQSKRVHVYLCVYVGACVGGAQSMALRRMRRQTVCLSFPTTI